MPINPSDYPDKKTAMRDHFIDLPMTQKLQRLQAITLSLALLFTLLITCVTQIWQERREMLAESQSLSNMLSFNAGAALMFDDKKTGNDILATLRGKPEILAAQLYNKDGDIFVHYPPGNDAITFPATLTEAQAQLRQHHWQLAHYVLLYPFVGDNGEIVGSLRLVIDLRSTWHSVLTGLGQIFIVMLISFVLAVIYGRRLAQSIAEPLTRLSSLAKQVYRDNNYMVRAPGEGNDEIGQLVKSFNQMITGIQQRDTELESQRGQLEHEVDLRTADLRKAVSDAQMANVAKSQFLATMSHEIRTPMNGVLGMTELLLGTELNSVQRQYAETVFSSADTLLNIINDILDFSKIEAGKLELEEIDFSLIDLTEQITALFYERAHSKQIQLSYDIDPSVPHYVRGDPYRLRQIITNLLSNAIKFTEAGVVKLDVNRTKIDPCNSESCVCLTFTVSDTGIGISSEILSRLFESFKQADGSTTRKYGGTGLGLAISKELSELMGGYIRVQSQPNVGSVFTVGLPLRVAKIPRPTAQVEPNLHGKRMLIVEDNPTNIQIMESYITDFGAYAHTARTGTQALERLQEAARLNQYYAIALLDMKLIDMSGVELTQKIRDDNRFDDMRIAIITSDTNEVELNKIRYSNCDFYLYKPLYRRILRDALLNALAKPVAIAPTETPVAARVLLAEDNPVNQKVCRAMLQQLGYQVIVAVNGKEAVAIYQQEAIDLILMDCMMPEMDGYMATQQIRQLEQQSGKPGLPIIALTANAMLGDREKCLQVGMDDYLTKPFIQQILHDKMQALLHTRPNHQATPQASVSQTKTAPLFDPAPLSALGQIGGDKLVHDVLALFKHNAAQQIATAITGLETQDANVVRHAAHSLKSTAANIGALQLASLARSLEQNPDGLATLTTDNLAESLQTSYKETLQRLSSSYPS